MSRQPDPNLVKRIRRLEVPPQVKFGSQLSLMSWKAFGRKVQRVQQLIQVLFREKVKQVVIANRGAGRVREQIPKSPKRVLDLVSNS